MKITVDIDLDGAFGQLDEMQQQVSDKLRWAAWQGAELLREEMKAQAPRYHKKHYFYSKGSKNADGSKRRYEFEPGDLRRSLFAFFDGNLSEEGVSALYQVGWRHNEGKKAKYDGDGYKAVPYGYMVHNGAKDVGRKPKNKSMDDDKPRKVVNLPARPFTTKALAVAWPQMERKMLAAVKEAAKNGKADH